MNTLLSTHFSPHHFAIIFDSLSQALKLQHLKPSFRNQRHRTTLSYSPTSKHRNELMFRCEEHSLAFPQARTR